MITQHTYRNLTWFDTLNPTARELKKLAREANIPDALATDLKTVTTYPNTETSWDKGAIKLTLNFPAIQSADCIHPHEIKFIATKDHLVTIRFEDVHEFEQWQSTFTTNPLLTYHGSRVTGWHLLLALLLHLYRGVDCKLDYLGSMLQTVGTNLFARREKEMVFEISRVGQRLVAFRQALGTHERALAKLNENVTRAFPRRKYSADVARVTGAQACLLSRIDRQRQTLDELRETNNTLLTTKQNEIIKILTIMAFITFPLTLFTSLFSMNTRATPLIGWVGDFWIILGVMFVVSIGFFVFFKYKKWM